MSDDLLPAALRHLAALVACDTRNPPRQASLGGVLTTVREALPASFSLRETDLGAGRVCLLAVRGDPRLLVNCHLDTVPADPAWDGDPLALRVKDGRATGLGACDVKGAAAGRGAPAALLAAAAASDGPTALLFTTDEEHGDSRCVRHFAALDHGFDAVVVSEPTGCRAVTAHRGIVSVAGTFTGTAGHSSRADDNASALHQAVRWATSALALADAPLPGGGSGLTGLRFNLGRLEGGTKANVTASSAEVVWGARPPPEAALDALVGRLQACAPDPARVRWERRFTGCPLPASPDALARGQRLAADLGLPPGAAVDFWTEAALFSQAGTPALVFGPGDIAQAHSAGEWLALDQLASAAQTYFRLFDGGGW